MPRDNNETSRTARLCQLGCLILVMAIVMVALVQDVAERDPSALARVGAMMGKLIVLLL